MVLFSIYGFFLFESLMHLCMKKKVGDHGGHSHIDVKVINQLFFTITTEILLNSKLKDLLPHSRY